MSRTETRPGRCSWGHRNCLGHFIQPAPGEVIRLKGESFTRVSEEPGWFLMGYIHNDGRLTEVRDFQGEAFVVKYLRDYFDAEAPAHEYPDPRAHGRVFEWEAVTL
jgi:hypothetical protein